MSARATSAQASASRPENDASSADRRTPTAMSGPAPSRIASSTSRQKRSAGVEGAVVAVVAQVGARREELRGEVRVGRRELDAVHPALARPHGAGAEAVDQVADLGSREGARLDVEALRRHRGRRDRGRARRRGDLLAPAVEELQEETRAVRADGVAEAAVGRHDLGQVAADRVRRQEARGVHRGRLEEDRPDAAARPGLLVGDEVVGRHVVVHEARLVRRRDDAVAQLDRAELDRPQDVRVRALGAHARVAPRTATASTSTSIPGRSSADETAVPAG